jgi:hypothetical protein
MNLRTFSALPLALWSVLAAAQTPVYESKDKGGAVFTDQPVPGAKRIDLPPPNVIQTPATPQAAASKASPAAPPYRQLAIVSPQDQGTIHSNTGAMQLQVRVQPPLRASAGDRFKVQIDGNLLAKGFSSTALNITSADWARVAAGETIEHALQVAIVDRNGRLLTQSAPVRFFVHRAAR